MSTIKSSAENLTLNADGANNDVIIQSNGSTKVTVDGANGRVGIGQATPATELHIGLNDSSNHHATLTLNNGGATGNQAGINWKYENETNPRARVYLDSSGQELRFDTGNSERMRVTANGLTFNGDTAAANALDDYEEGTWTPVYSGSTTAGSYSMTHPKGIYTKIGNLVTVSASAFNVTQSSAGAGDIRILGLPFVVSLSSLLNNTFRGNVGALELDTWTFTGTSLSCTASAGNSYVNFRISKTGVADVVLQAGSQGAANNSDFAFSITYFTDS